MAEIFSEIVGNSNSIMDQINLMIFYGTNLVRFSIAVVNTMSVVRFSKSSCRDRRQNERRGLTLDRTIFAHDKGASVLPTCGDG